MIKHKNYLAMFLFLLPALLIYLVLVINPVVQSVFLSFFEWNGIPSVPLKYVGLNNFADMFGSSVFWRSLGNSGWFIITSFLVQLPLSFILANIITSNIKGLRFFKTAFPSSPLLSKKFINISLPLVIIPVQKLIKKNTYNNSCHKNESTHTASIAIVIKLK